MKNTDYTLFKINSATELIISIVSILNFLLTGIRISNYTHQLKSLSVAWAFSSIKYVIDSINIFNFSKESISILYNYLVTLSLQEYFVEA